LFYRKSRTGHFSNKKNWKISIKEYINGLGRSLVIEEPTAKKNYLEKLDKIRKGKFFKVKDFEDKYGLTK